MLVLISLFKFLLLLLQLLPLLSFAQTVVPVCLPRRGAAFPLGRDSRLVAAGWGKTTRGRFQGDISTLGVHRRTPQKVELPHVSPGRCEAAYQRDLLPRFFCAGGRRGMFNDLILGPVTRRKSRDETRDGLVDLVSRPKVTRRDDIRDQVKRNKYSLKFYQILSFCFLFFPFETEILIPDRLARQSHETRRDRDGLVSSRLFSRRDRLVTGPTAYPRSTEIAQCCPKMQAGTPATATAGGRWWRWRRGTAGAASGGTSCTWWGSSPSGRSRAVLESQVRKWRTRWKRNTDHPFFFFPRSRIRQRRELHQLDRQSPPRLRNRHCSIVARDRK